MTRSGARHGGRAGSALRRDRRHASDRDGALPRPYPGVRDDSADARPPTSVRVRAIGVHETPCRMKRTGAHRGFRAGRALAPPEAAPALPEASAQRSRVAFSLAAPSNASGASEPDASNPHESPPARPQPAEM